ncbi:hypothetical protein CC85DRAFT_262677 [Cutaneotrichosporon oleaginosum]|uniref:Mmc1 C-terminal domain-containing protein n=1 Tax=Cutaneotrichosporon oleaginosum TaxID=879819 RepID=A0A0J1B0B7_9TREE|nr:uncharacterized protein CC85DRAFT_262677 [Cutaneotrichosporon oleaginosum]KLT41029.1 hypothetical protein CC85DRAFT_262677 [Cutaneotrichosporon oleaginosum]TXT12121.1 hypothetical protein COLE_02531 [Cutaneotrichosporon oleaginosum]
MKSRATRVLLTTRPPLRPAARTLRFPSKSLPPTAQLCRQWTAPFTTSGPSLRRYATAATSTATTSVTGGVGGQEPPLAPFLPTPVAASENLRAVLKDVEKLLVTDIGGSSAWYDRIKAANADLSATRRARLAVYGDPVAAPHDVVSAFLQDPLSDSDVMRKAILDRYFGTSKDTLFISLANEPSRTDGRLGAPSSWLQASGCDVAEIAQGPQAESQILACDAVAFVLDPVRLATTPFLSKLLPLALGKGHVQFIVNGPLPAHQTEETLRAMLDKQLAAIAVPTGCKSYDVTFVQADLALRALDALARALSEPDGESKGLAFDTFQHDFPASKIGPLQAQLMHLAPTDAQIATAASTARLALAYTNGVVASDRDVLRKASDVVSQLRKEAVDGSGRARRLSVVSMGSSSGIVDGSVDASIRTNKHALEQLFKGRLSWLGILTRLRVDDVNGDIGGYIARNFARDIEQQLVFEAGQLSQLQSQLGKQSDETARSLTSSSTSERAGHPFSSPLLLNHLASLALAIPSVTPTSLLPPVATRRAQLVNTAVPQLQVTAQRALGSSITLALAGTAGAWTAFAPPLSWISGATAVGLGALAVVSSLALGQAWWAKGQRRFWKDWNRVTAMLKDDLCANFDSTVDKLVLARPRVTADGLQELVRKREERLNKLEHRIITLEEHVEALEPSPQPASKR